MFTEKKKEKELKKISFNGTFPNPGKLQSYYISMNTECIRSFVFFEINNLLFSDQNAIYINTSENDLVITIFMKLFSYLFFLQAMCLFVRKKYYFHSIF